jgi:hypothetical protein
MPLKDRHTMKPDGELPFWSEFGREAYRVSVVLAVVGAVTIIASILAFLGGLPPPTSLVRFLLNVVIGTSSIGSVLLGASSAISRFRIGAVVITAFAILESVHFFVLIAV